MRVNIITLLFFLTTSYCVGATYYSISDGDWGSAIWSTDPNAVTGTTIGTNINNNDVVIIRHNVTNNSGAKINNGGTIQITSTGYLDITELQINGGSSGGTINIDPGGTLEADVINNKGNVNNNGTIISPDCDQVTGGTGTCSETPLPVELLHFNARSNDQYIELYWSTASELNNDLFTLERSKNGKDFERLTMVDGNGTTSEISNYTYTDDNPYLGLSYYRLSQTDHDGTTEIFPVISELFKGGTNKLSIVPNPITENGFRLKSSGLEKQEVVKLKITDLQGKSVEERQLVSDAFGNLDQEILLIKRLKKGTYIVELVTKSNTQYQKIIAE